MKNIFYSVMLLTFLGNVSSFAKSNDNELMSSCNNEDKKSCYELGLKYFNDEETDKIVKGTMLLNQACILKFSPACVVLGYLFYNEKKIAKDYSQAYNYFLEACAMKDGGGCHALANMYELGNGVEEDRKKALIYRSAACETGSPYDCYLAGKGYQKGDVLEKNICNALYYYYKSCFSIYAEGCEEYEKLKEHTECYESN
jgi:TPR repeat protein